MQYIIGNGETRLPRLIDNISSVVCVIYHGLVFLLRETQFRVCYIAEFAWKLGYFVWKHIISLFINFVKS